MYVLVIWIRNLITINTGLNFFRRNFFHRFCVARLCQHQLGFLVWTLNKLLVSLEFWFPAKVCIDFCTFFQQWQMMIPQSSNQIKQFVMKSIKDCWCCQSILPVLIISVQQKPSKNAQKIRKCVVLKFRVCSVAW